MTDIKTYTVSEPYLKIDCGLGEAPFWEEKTNTLRFVDIVKSKVHTIDLNEGPSSHKVLADLDISIGCTADIEDNDDDFAFGGKHGYGILNRKTAEYKYIKKYWMEEEINDGKHGGKENRMRGNDGAVDSQGRFWVSTMNDPLVTEPVDEGVLFRLDSDMTLHRMVEGLSTPNGITWSPDDKTMYFADGPTKNIFAFDYDAATGNISNKRVFFRVEDEGAVPDGHCIDEEGYMWTAVFGAGKVVRISPEGKAVAEIKLPTRSISCPAFAGEDLFITSAEEEEPDKYPESAKLQGSLFKCSVGIKGRKLYRFKYHGDKV
ncbi:rRNA-processing protein cgr1 [Coniosporium tulheliwenetii]|uniref:rRNA-processing protein cgr1 n=1 Tax=Coniosporium tulheliwenetii TaxID=3383036 RepID=A0ACC2Z9T2_9PEZI|nr:rRNA-processing protein cgr1 [Cladosporium sp. JES 115]